MRYKRVNTLALDVSSTPNQHRVPAVRLFLISLELDPAKLRSVQFHSSGKTIFIGLPDDRSAATIAAKTPRFGFGINGEAHYIPVEFVDEDITEVRVRDLPPETPTELIQQSLQQYGEVLSVNNEVWRNFFPGVPTGVKIARMKLSQQIPSRITIGSSHQAQVNYIGQPSRYNKSHPDANSTAKLSIVDQQQQQPAYDTGEAAGNSKQKQQKKKMEKTKAPMTSPAQNPQTEDNMIVDEAPSHDGFTVVTRNRAAKQRQTAEKRKQSTSPHSVPAGPTASEVMEAVRGPLTAWLEQLQKQAAENSSKKNKK